MTKLKKWEKSPKYVGNYSTGELLIHLGMDIKKYEISFSTFKKIYRRRANKFS